MPDHAKIYLEEAEKYARLIASQPPLDGVIEEIRPFEGLDIVDIGAGTGRLSAVLAPRAKSLVALDASQAMLNETARQLSEAKLSNWRTEVADHRRLPLEDGCADLVVAGWSVCYLASADAPDWEDNLRIVMSELKRIVRSKGTIILFETMGTGVETPAPPDFLLPYYAQLANLYGFAHRWIRTDYLFESTKEAEEMTRFFFGDELGDRVAREELLRVPECGGVWWLMRIDPERFLHGICDSKR
ncbi:class I SAM-dependent methyltransferase [Cohnella faecalis]|uniref:Class I SAM-dependent methyltransferase n=1 Tax=Cohnella faecalis TaxID=2315694 RepID=A0A398D164_9BACL|nr:class I SAM-dependent methyltransferase [Cohnella faecalis]RIE04914.1 class I SAM-dependent methyltransferase [Cohnella faecalis]